VLHLSGTSAASDASPQPITTPLTNPGIPVRNDARNDATRPCPVCQQPFVPRGRQRVCSAACRQTAWRRRHPPSPPLPTRSPQVSTVYECPACDTRYLGIQRCEECGLFCRRVGPGGLCPSCNEPVALSDLVVPAVTAAGG